MSERFLYYIYNVSSYIFFSFLYIHISFIIYSKTKQSPCVPMRERHECHCMLFLTEDNDFVGTDKNISFDEVQELSAGFGT